MTIDLTLLLAAISAVETGNLDAAKGSHGEVSRYQMTQPVWRANRESGLCRPNNPDCSLVAASRHLHSIVAQFKDKHVEMTVLNLAVAWNYGMPKFEKKKFQRWKCPQSVRDYSARVTSVYLNLELSQIEWAKFYAEKNGAKTNGSPIHNHKKP